MTYTTTIFSGAIKILKDKKTMRDKGLRFLCKLLKVDLDSKKNYANKDF